MSQVKTVFLLLLLGSMGTSLAAKHGLTMDQRSAKILLVAPPAMGHIIPLLRLGEMLVKRGHQVGFCTTEVAGTNITQEGCKQYGIKFIAAGPDPFTWYTEVHDMYYCIDVEVVAPGYNNYYSMYPDTI